MDNITILQAARPEILPRKPWTLARVPSGEDFAFELRAPKQTYRNGIFGVVAKVQFKVDADLILSAVNSHQALIARLESVREYLSLALKEETSKFEMSGMLTDIENTLIDAGGV